MTSNLNDDRVWFYNNLRTNPRVIELGVEPRIRELTEQIFVYINHANLANQHVYNQIVGRIGAEAEPDSGRVFLVNGTYKVKEKPVILDFSDIAEIALFVGCAPKPRRSLINLFFVPNPMDALVQQHADNYYKFVKTDVLGLELLDADVVPSITDALNEKQPRSVRAQHLEYITEKSMEHLNRMERLLWMSDASGLIFRHHYDLLMDSRRKEADLKRRGFDEAGESAEGSMEKLRYFRARKLKGYFVRQAAVNGYLFRTLNCLRLKLGGEDDGFKTTETAYKQITEKLKKGGTFIRHKWAD